jgi:hypothetical protein
MKTDQRAKNPTDPASSRYTSDTSEESTNFEDKVLTVVSLGTIFSGGLACLASVGIGMSLVLVGSMVLAEL